MIATFKETLTSLQDNQYGGQIITKPLKSVIWYWLKYLLFLSVFPLIVAIILLTRYLPQSPKFIHERFPDGVIGAKDQQLFSTIAQPYRIDNPDFSVILDLEGSEPELDSAKNGVLILKDKIVTKNENGQIETRTYGKIPDFSVDKNQIADWISQNSLKLWFIGLLIILIGVSIGLAISFFMWTIRLLIATVVFWLISKYVLKKSISYLQTFNIVVYASILPQIISFILSLAPSTIFSYLSLFIFLFFGYTWIKNLPTQETLVLPSPSSPSKTKSSSKK
jgi:hypothetical protein